MSGRRLIRASRAYGIIEREKNAGKLSHAYLIVCQDQALLRTYLKYFASLILSAEDDPRADRLILEENYADCGVYPPQGKNASVADVNEIVEKSIVKPLESHLRVFVLSDCQSMNLQSQNKLLKTLEEPPKNVVLLLGATGEASLLATVKSRVKILEIPPFGISEIAAELSERYGGREDIKLIAAASEGQLGKAEALIGDEDFLSLRRAAYDIAANMESVKELAKYSASVNLFSKKLKEFLSVLKIIYRDILMYRQVGTEPVCSAAELESVKKAAAATDEGAALSIIELINRAEEDLYYNANASMQIERLLICIMEEKYRWQRL